MTDSLKVGSKEEYAKYRSNFIIVLLKDLSQKLKEVISFVIPSCRKSLEGPPPPLPFPAACDVEKSGFQTPTTKIMDTIILFC